MTRSRTLIHWQVSGTLLGWGGGGELTVSGKPVVVSRLHEFFSCDGGSLHG